LNDELFPLVNENPYELPHYQVDRIRRCFPNVNILLTITIGIGLLTVAIISFFILSQKLRSTSSTDFHIIDELSSTCKHNFHINKDGSLSNQFFFLLVETSKQSTLTVETSKQ